MILPTLAVQQINLLFMSSYFSNKLSKGKIILFLLGFLVVLTVMFLVISKQSGQKVEREINGDSMIPTLKEGQRVLVEYGYYKDHQVNRGDIIVMKFKTRDFEDVKRVIAIPGDKIVFGNNSRIYLNDKILEEDYIKGESFRKEDLYLLLKQLEYFNNTLPKGYYLVFGDNREISYDSTNYGLVLAEQIVGKVVSLKTED
ncbi:MAG: signal peptidase I [Nanoarchaeota archaeon]|nr:signal peptidase I [Nanoarchaeota archaeon]